MSIIVPERIKELIETFNNHKEEYKNPSYNETQARRQFIDPLFEALGWDVENRSGTAEAYKDVVHEDAIKIDGFTKAPDYCFRVGGARKFFVEAKKPAENLLENPRHSFQLRRYAWSAKLPIGILTDFEEFVVYDTRYRPYESDPTTKYRIFHTKYTDFPERWEEIYNLFSKQAVQDGSLDAYAELVTAKKGTEEVDDTFLKEIEYWRELLAKDLAKNNPELKTPELNFAVQKTIDRIIFLRISEARGIEDYGRLLALQNNSNIYDSLGQLFEQADDKYNSGLFHFQQERDSNETADTLTLKLSISDHTLKEIIKNLYYPNSPYEFSVLPADVLGQVYEQFLGKVIRLTDGHRAVIEEKPEVRKAGGVYYTPTYIVNYIVKQTVGKLLEGKTPKQVEKIKILDPACGSGSFLIGAYQYLLDWHIQYYKDNLTDKLYNGKNPVIYQMRTDEWRLTTAEKRRILLNNIYGVDIDSQAVEVTKLSLSLKVLEGENEETLHKQLQLFHERALPDMGENIKCGNSLIAPDFYNQQMDIFDTEEQMRINAFDWNNEFKDIIDSGGFDTVIGNPPYVRQETISFFKDYLAKNYKVYHGVADLYTYFIEKGITLLKPNGYFSYIVANKWLRTNYGEPLRKLFRELYIKEIIDFGDLPVFKGATTYPCIIVVKNTNAQDNFNVCNVTTLQFNDLDAYIKDRNTNIFVSDLDDKGWRLVGQDRAKVLKKLNEAGIKLGKYIGKNIYRGILTGLNEAFVIDENTKNKLVDIDPKSELFIKKFIIGKDIKRYSNLHSKKYVICIPQGWTNKESDSNAHNKWEWFSTKYISLANHLYPYKENAEKRWDKGDYWWELRACDFYSEFEKNKIVYPNICKQPEFTFDTNQFYNNQKCFIIPLDDKYLLGILNSSISYFLFQELLPKLRGGFYEPSYVYFKNFPIPERTTNESIAKIIENNVNHILELNKKIHSASTGQEKIVLSRQIETTDHQIDQLVYDLYGLTEDEIKTVEEQIK